MRWCGGQVLRKVSRTIVAHAQLEDTADGVTYLRIFRLNREIRYRKRPMHRSRETPLRSSRHYIVPTDNVGKALFCPTTHRRKVPLPWQWANTATSLGTLS